ncbi:MAG: hypothetical protein ABW100_14805, partial [Candidatus Thiodiazotropha sp. 6PLUC3]
STPTCSDEKNINVRDSLVMVMAESFATITNLSGVTGGEINIPTGGSVLVSFRVIGQGNGQVMPLGTSVEFLISNGEVGGDSSFTVPNTNYDARDGDALGVTEFSVLLTPSLNEEAGDEVGGLQLKVTTPGGGVSLSPVYVVND